ncbi:hypothetical protein [Clostridium sp. FP2]|uniref:hypothetical protein n=1 Tax=Clostridium sp. FP2 TaxID=2724481 RepID=UPI0029620C65|nr:hypothetical protein [Clostridium sp. FP2]
MTYLFRFLLKIILLVILLLKSFSMFNYHLYISGKGGTQVLPLLSIILLINLIYECILLKKKNNWYYLTKDSDERTQKFTFKAGYITFWINMIGISLIFILYSSQNTNTVKPLNLVGGLLILEILIYNIIKYYYIHNELSLGMNIDSDINDKNKVCEIKSVNGKISIGISIILILLILNLIFEIMPIRKIEGLPILLPLFISPIGILLGIIPLRIHKDKLALIGVITNMLLWLVPIAYFTIGTLIFGP